MSSDQSTSHHIKSAVQITDQNRQGASITMSSIHSPWISHRIIIPYISYMHNYSIYILAPLHSRSTSNKILTNLTTKDQYSKEMVNKYKTWHGNIKKWTIFRLSRYLCLARCYMSMHNILDAAQLTYRHPLANIYLIQKKAG